MSLIRGEPVENPHPLDYRFTWVLMIAATVLTIRWHTGYDMSALLERYEFMATQPWRLFSSCLLHGGVLHLGFNLYWTWRFGQILEPILGLVPMIVVCVLLGAGSSGAQWAFSGPSVGLSGIGYGLFGMLWTMHRYAPNYRGVMDNRTAEMFALWFFLCIAFSYFDVLPIANVAHGAGALLGALFGLSLSPFRGKRTAGLFGSVLTLALIGALATALRPYVNVSPARGWELAYEGTEALEAGDFARAVEQLEAAVERDPEQPWAWHNLGVAYERTGRMSESREALERAQALRRERERERGSD